MSTSLLEAAMAHHIWATERLIDTCAALSPEQLKTPVPGTYGSITATFLHLVEADCFYLSVVNGFPAPTLAEEPSFDELRSVMTGNGTAWANLLARDLDADADVMELDQSYEFHVPMGIRLAQVIHHGTDHRSQICTALTSVGVQPPEIDVWAYADATGRQRVVPPPAP